MSRSPAPQSVRRTAWALHFGMLVVLGLVAAAVAIHDWNRPPGVVDMRGLIAITALLAYGAHVVASTGLLVIFGRTPRRVMAAHAASGGLLLLCLMGYATR